MLPCGGVYFVTLSQFRQSSFFNWTTTVVFSGFPVLKVSPYLYDISIVGYAKVTFLYQLIYLLNAFNRSSLTTEKVQSS